MVIGLAAGIFRLRYVYVIKFLGMNKALGNAVALIMLLLLPIVIILYVLNPDPAASPTVSLIINGSLGAIVILLFALAGMVMKDADFDTQ